MGDAIKGFVIAGTKSGCGKTTITLGILSALSKRGIKTAPFKVGPDFIDPGHHNKLSNNISRNLDSWMLSYDYNLKCFFLNSANCDVAVVEGVMGLFDGYDGKSEAGSTAQIAKWLGLPVILIVDAKSMARSVAALVLGFEKFDPDLSFAGVIFNNVKSNKHISYLKEAISKYIQMPCLGGIDYNDGISIPERHLGLLTSEEYNLSDDVKNKLANLIESNVDIDGLINKLPDITIPSDFNFNFNINKIQNIVNIGIAYDSAFCFYYKDNLYLLEKSGAKLIFFSPVKDTSLPKNLDGIYLGGGYPELFAKQLAENTHILTEIKKKSDDAMPVYAECGGFMYLCQSIIDKDNKKYSMTGCFPFNIRMLYRLKSLGYREITLIKDCVIGKSGQKVRGHEFHYSEIIEDNNSIEKIYNLNEGYLIKNTLASYIHLHFGSNNSTAKNFVEVCLKYKEYKDKS